MLRARRRRFTLVVDVNIAARTLLVILDELGTLDEHASRAAGGGQRCGRGRAL